MKNNFLLIIIIVIVIVAAVGVYYYFNIYSYYSWDKITERDLYCGSYFGDYNQKKIGTPDSWILSGRGTRSATWHSSTNYQSPITCDYNK